VHSPGSRALFTGQFGIDEIPAFAGMAGSRALFTGQFGIDEIPAFAGMAGSRRLNPGCAGMAGDYEPATFIRSIKTDPTVFAP
jgi:hypothetical protein